MTRPPILIAGATGHTGRVATQLLLEKGFPVRALVHKDDERSARLKDLGAEIFVGDLLDLRAVRRAFDGMKRAYFVYPILPDLVQATATFAQAAVEAKAEFIVNLSQRTAREDALSDSALQHWLAERVLDWAGTPVTHLRPVIFNEWLLFMQKGIREGHYRVPFGTEGKFAPISTEDQGRVIAEVLADPEPHVGKTHLLLGPVELTPPEVADIVSKTLGKPVRYEQITGAEWVKEVFNSDMAFGVQHVTAIAEMHALGQMAGTNDVVETITGRRPQTVAEFVEQHRAAFQ
ncbi:NmrA family NAD(P)-binding protein [Roseixanthobacter glucoisosaccharinicivorans]|uniref:NmrA family NAD(P)-binding protein n=1 Tax=Roseixanthobacter glucoisosaccharinicivorans TaxID=3119923 RepID=UPI003728F7B7